MKWPRNEAESTSGLSFLEAKDSFVSDAHGAGWLRQARRVWFQSNSFETALGVRIMEGCCRRIRGGDISSSMRWRQQRMSRTGYVTRTSWPLARLMARPCDDVPRYSARLEVVETAKQHTSIPSDQFRPHRDREDASRRWRRYQIIHNSSRENSLKAALCENPTADPLEILLLLLDATQVQHLAYERDSMNPNGDGGKTPLHRWLFQLPGRSDPPHKSTRNAFAILRLLLKYFGGCEPD